MLSSSKTAAAWVVVATIFAFAAAPLLHAAPDTAGEAKEAIAIARDFSRAFSAVARQAGPAVVFIETEARTAAAAPQSRGMPFGYPPQQPGPHRGQGSGFLVSADGLLLTNAHVVKDARRIHVKMQDGRTYEGELVGSDAPSDVALVRIAGKDLPYLTMADSDALEVGAWVVAIGNPFGLRATVTSGIVSAKGRNQVGIADYENFIQTDASINPGNSGGPLLDLDGHVVGINSAIYSRSGGSVGIGFAIPSNLALQVKAQLLDHGAVTRGYLGVVIQDLTPALAESFGLAAQKGALVARVAPESPAAQAGFQVGDVVASVDGKAVDGAGALRLSIGRHRPGTEASFRVVRDGKERTVALKLGRRDGGAAASAAQAKPAKALGLSLEPLTEKLAERLGIEDADGVLVSSVEPHGPAARAGLRAGALILSVNGKAAGSVATVLQVLERAQAENRSVRLRVREGEATRFLLLRFD